MRSFLAYKSRKGGTVYTTKWEILSLAAWHCRRLALRQPGLLLSLLAVNEQVGPTMLSLDLMVANELGFCDVFIK